MGAAKIFTAPEISAMATSRVHSVWRGRVISVNRSSELELDLFVLARSTKPFVELY